MISNPIIPSDPMRNAVTKTSETEKDAVAAGEAAAFAYSKTGGGPIGVFLSGLKAYRETLATSAPEPQPEVAAEPDAYQKCHEEALFQGFFLSEWETCTRSEHDHIQETGLNWDGTTARSRSLYATPPVVEEAVKAERCDGQLCYYHGCQALPGCAHSDARSATP